MSGPPQTARLADLSDHRPGVVDPSGHSSSTTAARVVFIAGALGR
jgi:hypothetical protein